MIKNMHSVSEFKAHSVFQVKRKLLKNSECKKYIVNSVKNFRENSVFRASASCSEMLNGEKFSMLFIQCIFT